MVAAQHDRDRARAGDAETFSWITRRERSGRPGTTGASPASTTVSTSNGATSVWIDHDQGLPLVTCAARIAIGPNRAPGRAETPSS